MGGILQILVKSTSYTTFYLHLLVQILVSLHFIESVVMVIAHARWIASAKPYFYKEEIMNVISFFITLQK